MEAATPSVKGGNPSPSPDQVGGKFFDASWGGGETNRAEIAMLARTILAVTFVLASVATQARDNGQYAQVSPDIKRWVEGLTDNQGRGCCATADGFRPNEVDWDIAEGAYKVMINGQWFTVPDGAVIKQTNRIGYALVWYFVSDGKVYIRCFLPGSGA
jgi:hypothetical protein